MGRCQIVRLRAYKRDFSDPSAAIYAGSAKTGKLNARILKAKA